MIMCLRPHVQLRVRRKPIFTVCIARSADADACMSAASSAATEAASQEWDLMPLLTAAASATLARGGRLVSSLQGMPWAGGAGASRRLSRRG